MRYSEYSEEDFIADAHFQRWVLDSNSEVDEFWTDWSRKHPEKRQILNSAIALVKSMHDGERLSDKEVDELWNNILEMREDKGQIKSRPRIPLYKNKIVLFGVAASILGIILSIFKMDSDHNPNDTLPPEIEENAIILKLQDGTHQILNENGSEIILETEGSVVTQNHNQLIYGGNEKKEFKLKYNELKVPYGKKFGIVLSDGSHVFLNSGTTLKYPVVFASGTTREVYLDGEAYFSVEKDSDRPFIVVTKSMNTQVYGTKFNVSSYSNETNIETVLVEGSVGVYPLEGRKQDKIRKIVPGERALFTDDHIVVDNVNVNKYTAWTEGKLFFNDDEFEKILKELERHFNVVIHNEIEEMNLKKFTGTFTEESIEEILNVFQEHTSFKFSRKEKVITIYMED
ncbi:FecR family protein [Pareuzebyella sediminis]|uniref:FecR family protein n=1 Tax=Pareuzebyella sediminis TaxID=2607998 RepID=UPI0011EF7CB7|nr:FecR family protein [Pareuzebyella sediminis]